MESSNNNIFYNIFFHFDLKIKTERLMTLLPLPSNCVAFEELPSSECSRNVFMELFGTLQHPYIYPILDLEFFEIGSRSFACLVMPFNPKGSLKDLIYKVNIMLHTECSLSNSIIPNCDIIID